MSAEFTFRQGLALDEAAIRDLTREAYAKWVPVIGREPVPMAADYAEALRHHRFDLVFDGPKLVALIETILHADHHLIENVAVAPGYQGKRLGRRLIAHVEAAAMAAGVREIKLYTNQKFSSNLSFYAKLGFAVEREDNFKGGIVVHFHKAVPSQNP